MSYLSAGSSIKICQARIAFILAERGAKLKEKLFGLPGGAHLSNDPQQSSASKDDVSSEKPLEGLKLYLILMEELKVRFRIINETFENKTNLPPALVREICFLQFRFSCEIIALSCLAAHGDIPRSKAMISSYEPRKIFKELSDLKPNFYPQPMELVDANGAKVLQGLPDKEHLKKDELLKLWGISGNFLHRTPMAKLYSKQPKKPDDFSDIFCWSRKLTGLLNSHWITTKENRQGLYVTLRSTDSETAKASILDFDVNSGEVSVTGLKLDM